MVKFTDEHKAVKEFTESQWLDFGVHKVKLALFELGETDGGKEYIEVSVLGPNNEEDTARLWFSSDAAINYSVNVLRQIYVHNAPADKKEEARATMDAIASTEELERVLNERLIGGECWFSKYPDPTRTYTAKDGTTKPSINKNVHGYEPRLRLDLLPKDETLTQKDLDDLFPADKAAGDTSNGIPRSW